MVIYNDSFMDNATNIVDIMVGIGQSMSDPFLFGNLAILSFFLVFMVLSFRNDFLEVIVVNSFITTILAILFYIAGLVSPITIAIPFVILIITVLFFFFTR